MVYSKRGILECIPCPPGYICGGCDVFEKCPTYTVKKGDEEIQRAMISKPMSKNAKDDCTSCSDGYEPVLDGDACTEEYTDVCNEKLLRRCYNGCRGADGTKNLSPCEKMKCLMFCAKQQTWMKSCVLVLGKGRCKYLTNPPPLEGDVPANIKNEAWLGDCDVDCSGARELLPALTALLICVLALLH
jgi:hypothetical protein